VYKGIELFMYRDGKARRAIRVVYEKKKKKNYYSDDLYSVSERFRFINNNHDVIAHN